MNVDIIKRIQRHAAKLLSANPAQKPVEQKKSKQGLDERMVDEILNLTNLRLRSPLGFQEGSTRLAVLGSYDWVKQHHRKRDSKIYESFAQVLFENLYKHDRDRLRRKYFGH